MHPPSSPCGVQGSKLGSNWQAPVPRTSQKPMQPETHGTEAAQPGLYSQRFIVTKTVPGSTHSRTELDSEYLGESLTTLFNIHPPI